MTWSRGWHEYHINANINKQEQTLLIANVCLWHAETALANVYRGSSHEIILAEQSSECADWFLTYPHSQYVYVASRKHYSDYHMQTQDGKYPHQLVC